MASVAQKVGKIEIENFNFIWKIKDFEDLGKNVGDEIHSTMFEIKQPVSLSPYQWYFSLYPYGIRDSYKDCLSIFLKNYFSENYLDIEVNLRISLLSHVDSKEVKNVTGIVTFRSNYKYGGKGSNNMIRREDLLNQRDSLLVDNTLIIKCVIQLDPYSSKELNMNSTFHDNFQNLYCGERFSDVTIQIGRKKIKAHKCILAARSKTFSDMFHIKHEIGPSLIKITDFNYDVMNEVISFIYCDKVSNIQQLAKPLLQAAFKYKLDRLKVMCGRVLWKSLSVDNAVETLKIADSCGCSDLKFKTMQFIIKNMKNVGLSGGFKILTIEKPQLLEEILCAVAEKN